MFCFEVDGISSASRGDPRRSDCLGQSYGIAGMYFELPAFGEQSLINALVAGATIEDYDIADLVNLLVESNEPSRPENR